MACLYFIAELRKQEAYETLKIQIAHLYVQILSNIETLQRSAENIALYKGASAVAEQEYRNRRTSIHDVAKTKEQEFAANQDFALLRSTINDQLLTLEIISHTPILTIQGEKRTFKKNNKMQDRRQRGKVRETTKKYILANDTLGNENIIVRSQKYKESQYQYYAKSDKPFVSKGAYGYAHGGFTPQECIIPSYEFANENQESLGVFIVNKSALLNVTGTYFTVKLKAESVENTLFKAERKVVIQIYGNGALLSTSSVYRMTPSSVQEAEFALAATENVKVVVVDIQTQQQVDFCDVKKSVSRDLDDLF